MLKYIKQYAAGIDGVSIYPMFSLVVFFLFFVVLLYYVKKMDKKKVDEIRRMPLDLNDSTIDTVSVNNLKQA